MVEEQPSYEAVVRAYKAERARADRRAAALRDAEAVSDELASALRYELTHHHTTPVDCRAQERDRHIELMRTFYSARAALADSPKEETDGG